MRIYTFSIYSLQILVDANLWLFEIIKDASFGTPMKSSNIVVLHSIKKIGDTLYNDIQSLYFLFI